MSVTSASVVDDACDGSRNRASKRKATHQDDDGEESVRTGAGETVDEEEAKLDEQLGG
jgi:hypothetical protein